MKFTMNIAYSTIISLVLMVMGNSVWANIPVKCPGNGFAMDTATKIVDNKQVLSPVASGADWKSYAHDISYDGDAAKLMVFVASTKDVLTELGKVDQIFTSANTVENGARTTLQCVYYGKLTSVDAPALLTTVSIRFTKTPTPPPVEPIALRINTGELPIGTPISIGLHNSEHTYSSRALVAGNYVNFEDDVQPGTYQLTAPEVLKVGDADYALTLKSQYDIATDKLNGLDHDTLLLQYTKQAVAPITVNADIQVENSVNQEQPKSIAIDLEKNGSIVQKLQNVAFGQSQISDVKPGVYQVVASPSEFTIGTIEYKAETTTQALSNNEDALQVIYHAQTAPVEPVTVTAKITGLPEGVPSIDKVILKNTKTADIYSYDNAPVAGFSFDDNIEPGTYTYDSSSDITVAAGEADKKYCADTSSVTVQSSPAKQDITLNYHDCTPVTPPKTDEVTIQNVNGEYDFHIQSFIENYDLTAGNSIAMPRDESLVQWFYYNDTTGYTACAGLVDFNNALHDEAKSLIQLNVVEVGDKGECVVS